MNDKKIAPSIRRSSFITDPFLIEGAPILRPLIIQVDNILPISFR